MSPFASFRIRLFRVEEEEAATLVVVVVIYRNQIESYLIFVKPKITAFNVLNLRNPKPNRLREVLNRRIENPNGEKIETLKVKDQTLW